MTTLRIPIIVFLVTVACFQTENAALAQDGLRPEVAAAIARWDGPPNGHPRLFLRQHDLPELRRKASDPILRPAAERLLEGAERAVSTGVPDLSDYQSSRRRFLREAQSLGLAFVLRPDPRYARHAEGLIRYALRWPSWVMKEHRPLRVDLGAASVAFTLALLYDTMYDQLSPSLRDSIVVSVRDRVLVPFGEIYAAKSEWWTKTKYNWRSVICGEVGMAVLVFWEELDNPRRLLKFAVDGVEAILDNGGRDGGWEEGVGYWGYGIGQAVLFVEALRRTSEAQVDLYNHPFLAVTGDFALYLATPAGDGCFNFADCHYSPPNSWLMAALAARFRNPHWQWQARRTLGRSAWDLLFYDPSLPAERPKSLPRAKWFRGIQVATLRTDWSDTAVFVGFKSGKALINHSHLDVNSFVLNAFGKRLAIDVGSWPYAHALGFFQTRSGRWDFESNATIAHNTLLVDGLGQVPSSRSVGHILTVRDAGDFQYLFAEADSVYGERLLRFRRALALLDEGILVVVDDVVPEGPRQLEWLLHYEGNAQWRDSLLVVRNGDAFLTVRWLSPASDEPMTVSQQQRETRYPATYGWTIQRYPLFSIRPLLKQERFRFVIVLVPGKRSLPGITGLCRSEGAIEHVVFATGRRKFALRFDFERLQVARSR